MATRQGDDLPRNHWRWLKRWNAQEAVDWSCRQFPPEIQSLGYSILVVGDKPEG